MATGRGEHSYPPRAHTNLIGELTMGTVAVSARKCIHPRPCLETRLESLTHYQCSHLYKGQTPKESQPSAHVRSNSTARGYLGKFSHARTMGVRRTTSPICLPLRGIQPTPRTRRIPYIRVRVPVATKMTFCRSCPGAPSASTTTAKTATESLTLRTASPLFSRLGGPQLQNTAGAFDARNPCPQRQVREMFALFFVRHVALLSLPLLSAPSVWSSCGAEPPNNIDQEQDIT
jgi:hypothetical protein